MNVKTLISAYRQLCDIEKKQKQVDKLEAEKLNYGIIRDLINSAENNVVINLTFKDGTKMEIKKETPFDRVKSSYVEGF